MDRLIYVAMTGAQLTLSQQASVAHNLANATTTGFRAEINASRAIPVIGEGGATRTYVLDTSVASDFTPGAIQQTGRDLDVAIQGKGWLAVQTENGGEAYTRAGSLQVSPNGVLQTREGLSVLGDGGPISIPPDTLITIGGEGTVSVVPNGNRPNQVAQVGRIKLVNPDEKLLVKSGDGLFRLKDGSTADADSKVRLTAGALEASNVNVVEQMVNMISLARQFELQMKMLQSADSNDQKATQIMTLAG